MNENVPRLCPISVSVSPPISFGTFEIPKSRILARVWPSGRRSKNTFDGFRSR
jgi:hypothetical protein